MEYCKDGLKLVKEASHENLMEYNVNNKYMILIIPFIIYRNNWLIKLLLK